MPSKAQGGEERERQLCAHRFEIYSVGRTSKQDEIFVRVSNNEISSAPGLLLERLVKIHAGSLKIQKEPLDLTCGVDRDRAAPHDDHLLT